MISLKQAAARMIMQGSRGTHGSSSLHSLLLV
jgi:hypothetical protein